MGQLVGTFWIRVNGKLLRSKEGASIDLGGSEKETVSGAKVHGYYNKPPKPGRVEGVVVVAKGDSPEDLANIDDAEVTVELDTGQSYIITEAAFMGTVKITANSGGDVEVVYEGQPAERA